MKDIKWDVPPPPFVMEGEGTRSQRAGLAYERKVAKYIGAIFGEDEVHHGSWISWAEGAKIRYAQPDIVVVPLKDKEHILLIECKLSYKKAVLGKLLSFYGKLIKGVWPSRKILPIQIFKNRRGFKGECMELSMELLGVKIPPNEILYINLREFP